MTAYKKYPRAGLIKDWATLITLPREEVVALQEEWDVIEKENDQIGKDNYQKKNEEVNEVISFMRTKGIQVLKYKKNLKPNGYVAWFNKNVVEEIHARYPYCNQSYPFIHQDSQVVNGVTLSNNQSPTRLVQCYDRLVHQYKQEKAKLDKKNSLLVASVLYASKHDIEVIGLSDKEIVTIVNEHAVEEYLKKEVPDGTEVDLNGECDECDTYTQGERRCECGNRRISITVEGNIVDGFYYYPEPY